MGSMEFSGLFLLFIVRRALVLRLVERAVHCVVAGVFMVCPLRPMLPSALGPAGPSTVSTHAAYCHVINCPGSSRSEDIPAVQLVLVTASQLMKLYPLVSSVCFRTALLH